jgi:prepilin-type N-terminal cleavage/methylation domain-containing protein
MYKIMKRHKKGMALIEVIVAVGVFAIVIGGFMQALNTSILGTHRDIQINTALNVAQSQLEHVKSLPYDIEYDAISEIPQGYDIDVAVEPTYEGLQLITVTVTYQGKSTVVNGYKTKR